MNIKPESLIMLAAVAAGVYFLLHTKWAAATPASSKTVGEVSTTSDYNGVNLGVFGLDNLATIAMMPL